ncbi:MAG: hypothetical protein LBL75_02880 [Rickettsiales bacterium]|jgi:restriction endonuclease S subunit|nr:hypothetical protein [Rickettsiales bacterium]
MKLKFGDFVDIRAGYSLRTEEVPTTGATVALIQPKDITNGEINFDETKAIIIQNPEKHILTDGEIILLARGRFAAAVYKSDMPAAIVPTSFLRMRINRSDILPEYIAMYLNSSVGQNMLKRQMSGGTIQPFITGAELRGLEIVVAPMDLQKKLVAMTNEFNDWATLHNRQMELTMSAIDNIIIKNIGVA